MNFLILLFSLFFIHSVHADLSTEFAARSRNEKLESTAIRSKSTGQIALGIARSLSKSKVASGPEIRDDGYQRQYWYFAMANGLICAIPIALDQHGNPNFAFSYGASCQ